MTEQEIANLKVVHQRMQNIENVLHAYHEKLVRLEKRVSKLNDFQDTERIKKSIELSIVLSSISIVTCLILILMIAV